MHPQAHRELCPEARVLGFAAKASAGSKEGCSPCQRNRQGMPSLQVLFHPESRLAHAARAGCSRALADCAVPCVSGVPCAPLPLRQGAACRFRARPCARDSSLLTVLRPGSRPSRCPEERRCGGRRDPVATPLPTPACRAKNPGQPSGFGRVGRFSRDGRLGLREQDHGRPSTASRLPKGAPGTAPCRTHPARQG